MKSAIPMQLSLDEARQLIAASLLGAGGPRIERVSLAEAQGRWLAQPLSASFALPPLASSAMDGYAIRSADAAVAGPVELQLAGTALADGAAAQLLLPGQAWRITTGAPLPAGANAVVIQENCTVSEGRVRLSGPVSPGAHVRQRGEDFAEGASVLPVGAALGPVELALLGSFGVAEVRVPVAPRVAILTTGDELLEPGQPRSGSAIYDSNGAMLAALVRAVGGVPLPPIHLRDDPLLIGDALLRCARAADLVISCGGASVGDADHLPQLLQQHGHVHFWKLRIKPGMPVLYGSLDAGGSGAATPVLALPGNPVSALVTFLLLGRSAIRLLAGVDPADPKPLLAALSAPLSKRHTRREFMRGALSQNPLDGQLQVRAGPAQGSHHLSGLRDADVLLDLPESPLDWQAGRLVEVYRLTDWMRP